jgi:FAD/FMN-containing dehydrogenase
MNKSESAIARLKDLLGSPGWLHGADMAPYESDVRGVYSGSTLLVVRPATTAEVSEVVNICLAHDVAIVAQGGNTSLCGGSVPSGGSPCVILSLARMNRVESIDPLRYSVTVQAGCVLQTIHELAAKHDRTFAPDWGARGTATIGGAISTNGGGINVLRFGNTREQVMGLEVVLPDGRIWNGLRALRKDTSGYDLKQMFIGAEGTLGIVTRAVLKLHPRPTHELTMCAALAAFDQLPGLFALARSIGEAHLTAFELVHGPMVERALRRYPALVRPLPTQADWYVLIRFSGRDDVHAQLETLFEDATANGYITDAMLPQSIAQEQNLWSLRDEMLPFKYLTGKTLKWDVSVPIDCIVPFLQAADTCAKGIFARSELIAYGHVGDGNLHMSLWPDGEPGDLAFDTACQQVVQDIDSLIWQMGGSVCAEHGVGVENFIRIQRQKSEIEIELMGRLKAMLDPKTLFNPNKVVAPATCQRNG